MPYKSKEKARIQHKAWLLNHKNDPHYLLVKKQWRLKHYDWYKTYQKKWAIENKEKVKNYQLKHRLKRKAEALSHYGTSCECCGENNIGFLTLDHIDGGGNAHRKITGVGSSFYLWLARNKFPKGFRILCWNCNSGKSKNRNLCPHKSKIITINEVIEKLKNLK